ncbi:MULTISPECIES: tetratricopeptide repeat protein [Streptomyces]
MTITTSGGRSPRHLQDPQCWPLMEDWDALAAGAHRARPDDTGDSVPPYVPRDVDTELRRHLVDAAEQGGMVLLVGESTAGKTRAAHQAARTEFGGYRVLAPDSGADLIGALEVMAATHVRCVVWLDDLERFLGPGALEASVLAELVRLRVPVLATMQLRQYEAFYPQSGGVGHGSPSTARMTGPAARVLRQIEPLSIERRWSLGELERAHTCDDSRVIDAVTHHGSYGVAEYLAAGPALLAEWRHAIRPGGHPRGAALVSAAVDLTRTGLPPPYPTTLLATLHQHYLAHDPLLRPEPFDQALAWASRLRYGATSLLLPTTSPEAWNVFDYLPDHSPGPVASPAWEAALEHATDPDDRFEIGLHACIDAPHISKAAWTPLVDTSPEAANNLGYLLSEEGQAKEAEEMYRRALGSGIPEIVFSFAVLLHEEGRTDEAEEMYRRAIGIGSINAINNLGVLLENKGRAEQAAEMYGRAIDAGLTEAALNLGNVFMKEDRLEEAEAQYRLAIDAGATEALLSLGILLFRAGRLAEAEVLYRRFMAAGWIGAENCLGLLLEDTGRIEEAKDTYRRAIDAGDINSLYDLGRLLSREGHTPEAEELYRRARARRSTDGDFDTM